MSKFLIYMLNTLFCGYVLAICIICTVIFDNWQERTIAITMTLGSACIFAALLNRVLPHKLHILVGLVTLVEGPLLVIGAIVCLDVLEPWSMKINGMFAWVIFMVFRLTFTKKE